MLADPGRRLFNHFFLPPNYQLPYAILVGRDGVIRKVGWRYDASVADIEALLLSGASKTAGLY